MNCVICQLQHLCNWVFQNKGLFIKAPILLKFGPCQLNPGRWSRLRALWGISEMRYQWNSPLLFDWTFTRWPWLVSVPTWEDHHRLSEWLFSLQDFPISAHPHPQQILSKSLINGGDTCPPKNDGRPSAQVSKITECLVGYENIWSWLIHHLD